MLTFQIDEIRLAEVVKQAVREEIAANNLTKQDHSAVKRNILQGMKQLQALLGCGPGTAQRLKNSGIIPYRQVGRKILFDAEEVLAAIDPNKRKFKRGRQ